MAKRTKGKSKEVKVDLTKVETRRKIPEGNYPVKLEQAKIGESKSGNEKIEMVFKITGGTYKGSSLYHNCSLQPQALFNLKQVLEALGFEIPKKAFDLDLDEIIGLECEVEVAHELWEGKAQPRIVDFINLEESSLDTEVDLEELDLEELKELAEELGVSPKKLKKLDEEGIIELIEEDYDEEEIAEAYEELFGDDE